MLTLLLTLLQYFLSSVLISPQTLFPLSIPHLHPFYFFLNLRITSLTFLHLHINPSCSLQGQAYHPRLSRNLLPFSSLSLYLSLLSPRFLFYLVNHLFILTIVLFLQFHLVDLLAGTVEPVGLILSYSLQLHPFLLQFSLMFLFLHVLKDLIEKVITNSMIH